MLATISDKGAGFRSLADAWADTTTPHGRLMLTVLGGLAEFERELIKARTEEGRKRAQARGVRFGRKLKLTQHQIAEALKRREAGEALVEIGRSYKVSHSTIEALKVTPLNASKIIAGLFRTFPNFIPNMSSPRALIFKGASDRSSPIGKIAGVTPTSLPIILTSRLNGVVISAGNSVFHQRKSFDHNQGTSDLAGLSPSAGRS